MESHRTAQSQGFFRTLHLPLEFIRGEDVTELLPDSTLLSVLYPSNKQLSPRVRVFVDWLVEIIGSRFHHNVE